MRTTQPDKRTRLIETATKLAYGRGFRETSLADIAEAARVPVGNVYYYFKTKGKNWPKPWWSGASRSFARPARSGTA